VYEEGFGIALKALWPELPSIDALKELSAAERA
jgi:hypothetical protein